MTFSLNRFFEQESKILQDALTKHMTSFSEGLLVKYINNSDPKKRNGKKKQKQKKMLQKMKGKKRRSSASKALRNYQF